MKKTIFLLIFYALIPGISFSQTPIGGTPPAAGDGSAGNPYQIATLNNLQWITKTGSAWSKHHIQIADIDASATSSWNSGDGFDPIGTDFSANFTGTYDGNNHVISGLVITRPAVNSIGLFGYTNGATIKNLGLTSINIAGSNNTGGLVGSASASTTISNSYTTGTVQGGLAVGGLTGSLYGGSTVTNSYSTTTVYGTSYTGGLAGWNSSATISNSYSRGDVERLSSYTDTGFGSFCGRNDNATIEYSYSTGSVTYSGVSDPTDKGFVGSDVGTTTYTNNFWDSDASNQTTSVGATAKTTTDLKTNTTFTSAGWDFVGETVNGSNNYWNRDSSNTINTGYPYHSWYDPEIILKQSSTDIADGGSYDFGSNNTGTDTDIVFTIENTGATDLTLTTPLSISGTNADQFSIQLQPVSPVAKSSSTTFTIRFSPTSVGAKTATISIPNNDSDENPYDLTINGTGTAPEIDVKQSTTPLPDGGSYNWGNLPAGSNADILFTIENNGTGGLDVTTPLTITGTNADQFSIQSQPSATVSASGSTTFTIRFAPTSAGLKTAALSITNSDTDEDPYDLTLNGTGTVPEINLKQSSTNIDDGGSYDYGSNAAGTNTDVAFTIENTGTAELNLSTPLTISGTNADQFTIQSQPSSSVSPSGDTTFTVRFSPDSAGAKTATISIASNDSDENPYDLTLNGTGTVPEINLKQSSTNIDDGGSYDYGSNAAGTSTDIVFTIENTGTANLNLSTPLSLTGTNADQFSIQSQPSSPVSPSGSSTFTVRFSPTSGGSKTAGIAITNNDSDENPYNLTLNGTGTVPEINLKQSTTDIADGGSYDYGNKTTGTDTDIIFTIENTGTAELTLSTPLTITGTNADQFSIQAQPSSPVPASGNKTFTLRFSPSSAGAKTASISITNNDSDENPYNLILNGAGVTGTQPPGSGTTEAPYLISILDHLLWVSTNSDAWDKYFEQTASINASNTSSWNPDGSGGFYGFSPIGSDTTPFTGSYDGKNFTISNLYINRSTSPYNGLFGVTGSATVKNLGLTDADITGYYYTGALVGDNRSSSVITNCYSTGIVSSSSVYTGGLIGANKAELRNCYSTCSVSSSGGGMEENYTHAGGLVGWNVNSALIINSYSTGSVSGTIYIGGLVGVNESASTITNCYSSGAVSSSSYSTGGFVGLNRATINNCFSTGDVTRSSGSGTSFSAFCGTAWDGSIEYSYSTGSVIYSGSTDPTDKGFIGQSSGSPTSANNFWDSVASNQVSATGATGKTTTEMKTVVTFTDLATTGLDQPWDFKNNPNNDSTNNDYWDTDLSGIKNDGYPYLVWQYPVPEMNIKQSTTDIADGENYDYGDNVTGTDSDIIFTIENTGTANLTITTPLSLTGTNADQFSIQEQPVSPVSAGGNTTFTVRFSPDSPGAKTAALAILNNDENENPYNLTLNGTGTAPEMNLKQVATPISDGGSYGFGDKTTGTNTDIVFTIENTGMADLTLTTPLSITGTNADQFSIQAHPSSPVSAGGSTTFTVRFSPTSSGSKTALISIINNDSDESPYDLTLSGSGNAPEMDLKQGTTPIADGNTYGYGNHAIGTNTDVVFTIENTGPVELALTTPLSITGTNADQFSIQSQPNSPISASGSTTFTVRFAPTSSGYKTASISIGNNDENENPYNLTLDGTGTAPEMDLKQGLTTITDGGMYNYGSITVNTDTDIEFTIENSGSADLTLTTPLSLSGTNADQFSIQSQPTSPVAAGGSSTFTVRFSPTSSGAKTASLSITNNDSNENPYNLTLNGIAGVPEINVKFASNPVATGDNCDFGDITTGDNTDITFTIENVGAGSLAVTAPLSITGTDADQFSILTQPTSPISAAGNTYFTIRFSPTSAGSKNASIAIANNDSDENPYNLVLSGWGAVPDIHLMQSTTDIATGDSYDFGDADSGSNTDVIFTIHNFGDGNLALTTPLTITGTNADQFNILEQPTSPVSAYGNTTFTVRFTPTSGGDKTASIDLVNSDGDENPYVLIMNGFGTGVPAPGSGFPWNMFLPAIISGSVP